jgi:hypothetical protein
MLSIAVGICAQPHQEGEATWATLLGGNCPRTPAGHGVQTTEDWYAVVLLCRRRDHPGTKLAPAQLHRRIHRVRSPGPIRPPGIRSKPARRSVKVGFV